MDRSRIIIGSLILLLVSGCTEPDGVTESTGSPSVASEEQLPADFSPGQLVSSPYRPVSAESSQESSLNFPAVIESIQIPAMETATITGEAVSLTVAVEEEYQPENIVETLAINEPVEVVELTLPVTTTETAIEQSDTENTLASNDAPITTDGLRQLDDISSCTEISGDSATNTTPPVAGSWALEFQDEFLGDSIDSSKWKLGQHWGGINGIAANKPENIAVDCGYLTITAEKKKTGFNGKEYQYASGELSTFKRFRQDYGYFEARIRYDGIQGLWPAFWLMPDRGLYGNVSQNRISYLKLDLRSETRPSVDSAVLELYVEAVGDGIQNLILQYVDDDSWSENTITWNNRPHPDPLWIEQHYDKQWSTGDTVRFDITLAVNNALAGDKILSLVLADTFMHANRVSFASKEAIIADRQPRLIIAGAVEPMIVSEDASVGEATEVADSNFGNDQLLHVEEDWALTATTKNGGMEFDIMESLGHWGAHTTGHALHWDGYNAEHQSTGSGHFELPPSEDGFHTYGLNWQPGHAEFYIDGNKTYEWIDERVGSVAAYIIVGLQMGGWADDLGDNRIVDDPSLPGEMVVDYVRVWRDASNW